MTLDPEKARAGFAQASKEYEVLRIKADQLVLPEDWTRLVTSWRSYAEKLPDELPQKPLILKLLGAAEYAIERDNEKDFRLYILKARMNFENAQHDKWLMGIQRQFGKDAEHRRQQVKDEREPMWQSWQREADRIRTESPIHLSKRALAIKIRQNLDITDSVDTIRKRIK